MAAWFKNNVATVVTWVLLGLAAASSVGAHSAAFEDVQQDVEDVASKVDAHDIKITEISGDVRALKSKQIEIAAEVKGFRGAISDLHRVVARLEAVVGLLKKGEK